MFHVPQKICNSCFRPYDYCYEHGGENDHQPMMVQQQQHHQPRQPPPPPPLPKPGHQYERRAFYHSPNSSQSPGQSSMASPGSGSGYYNNPGQVVAHAQYNSPLSLYSNENAAEAFRMQSGGMVMPLRNQQGGPGYHHHQQQPHQQQQQQQFHPQPALYKLIQEEEERQRRRQNFQNGKQYSADEGYLQPAPVTSYPSINNGPRMVPISGRPRPGSSMAHLAPANRTSPKEAFDSVVASIPKRPNRWSRMGAQQEPADQAEISRQAALRGRCASATRCLMNSSPSGVEEPPQIEDRAIRYRGAKIPSRTFQLLHAYTEFTSKDNG